jgi:hypothetical protein
MRKFSFRLVGVAGRGNTCIDLGNIHIAVARVGRNTLSTIMLDRVPSEEDTLAGRFPAFPQARCLGRAKNFLWLAMGETFQLERNGEFSAPTVKYAQKWLPPPTLVSEAVLSPTCVRNLNASSAYGAYLPERLEQHRTQQNSDADRLI